LHKDSVLSVFDFDLDKPSMIFPLNAIFRNCIFWGENGTVINEVGLYKKNPTNTITFDQILWKVQSNPSGAGITVSGAFNQPPLFDSINVSKNYYNFRLKAPIPLSPAIDKGANTTVTIDLDGKTRPLGLKPDLGCFEKQ